MLGAIGMSLQSSMRDPISQKIVYTWQSRRHEGESRCGDAGFQKGELETNDEKKIEKKTKIKIKNVRIKIDTKKKDESKTFLKLSNEDGDNATTAYLNLVKT